MRRVSILLLLFLSLVCSCYASGQNQEKTYQVTETQLVSLETRLQKLKRINTANLQAWEQQQKRLIELELKCQLLEKTLNQQYLESKKQEELLKSANQSFKTYGEETKKKIHREKVQKKIWIIIAGGLLYAYIVK